MAKGFGDFEVIVVGRFDELDRLAGPPHGSRKVAALALKIRRLVGAIGDNQRRAQQMELALRAHLLLHVVVELDVRAALGKAHRLHVVQAAHAQAAFDEVGRQAEILLPVGDQRHAAEVPARGVAADIELLGIAVIARDVLVGPRDPAAHLLGHHAQVAACRPDGDEIERDVVRARIEEQLG